AAWVMNNIFGSSPHSKLFCNVREKMSLCYYCSSRIIRPKGLIFIESGVEQGNIQKAKQAILDEFQKMKDADFTYEEINFAKLSLIDSIKSVNSDQLAIAHWFATRSLDEAGMTPDEACNAIESVTKEDIVNAASGFILDTVYRLLPDGTVTED
ncbi:MAG: insulinase family protein, partial [Clostridia bacterium]|nr:insulinase family protein [Clostridia bacterium]